MKQLKEDNFKYKTWFSSIVMVVIVETLRLSKDFLESDLVIFIEK